MTSTSVLFDLHLDDGKYRLRSAQTGANFTLEAWRHREPWPGGVELLHENRFSKCFVAILCELEEARTALRLAARELTPLMITATPEERRIYEDALRRARIGHV